MIEEEKIEGNIDIDQALKEFEAESALNQTNTTPLASQTSGIHSKEVSDIKFETDTYKSAQSYNQPDVPKMVGWVMKYGAIKNQKIAEYILVGIAIAIFALSLFFFFKGDTIISSI